MKYVGIIGRINDNKITYNREVLEVIYKYNCIPICISPRFIDNEFDIIKPLIDICNGFILQGGNEFYNTDLVIIRYLYENNVPTLGICLGMQTMAYLFNGKMDNIDNHYNLDKYVHNIYLNNKSKLYKIIGKNKILVNSRHKQCITNTDLNISSYSNIIESVEDINKKFFIGVQWHPESLMDENSDKLFKNFFFSIK